jgi:hypothetical protein
MPRLLSVALLAAAVGCGNSDIPKITLTGTVRYNGKPVSSGLLRFTGPNGFYSAASVQPDGTYTVTDVIPGELKVGIMDEPQGAGGPEGKSAGPRPAPLTVPAKFREPETSGLVYTVTADMTTLDIDIK